ncbi:MAG: PGN_0703 family putative restriction endonuclease [Acidobacteriota bacterium]
MTSSQLRREVNARNAERGRESEREVSYGASQSVIFREAQGGHGNFLAASYARIVANPAWRHRLTKSYTASRWVPRAADRKRYELECASSSDALLMNVFCYPGVLRNARVCALLGVEAGLRPEFGFRPAIPLKNGKLDRTEMDMRLGDLLVEAKLTEADFQRAPLRLVERYRDLEEVFDVERLPVVEGVVRSYQLIRCVLAAHASGGGFAVICDGRRSDLVERWFEVMLAVRDAALRTRLGLVTWQEIAATQAPRVQDFLAKKYGIAG